MSRLLGASREARDQRLVDMAKEEVMLGLSESILIQDPCLMPMKKGSCRTCRTVLSLRRPHDLPGNGLHSTPLPLPSPK